jgi:altronate hydrolase
MAAYGEGWELLRRTQWGYATHPNLGGALMVGLGCEVFQIDRMKDEYGMVEGDHFQTMTIQATGGTKKTVAEGVERIKAMLPIAAKARRETRPASEVTLALQCGGSDGYSGITANPALGAAADLLVKAWAARRCSRRRRKSTAPSISSRAARSTARSGKNSSSVFAGGRNTPSATTAR